MHFSDAFKFFLKHTIGLYYGKVDPGIISSNPVFTDLDQVISDAQQYGVPSSVTPFCEDNANFYCLTDRGEVQYWSHDDEGFGDSWPSLADWIHKVWVSGE